MNEKCKDGKHDWLIDDDDKFCDVCFVHESSWLDAIAEGRREVLADVEKIWKDQRHFHAVGNDCEKYPKHCKVCNFMEEIRKLGEGK